VKRYSISCFAAMGMLLLPLMAAEPVPTPFYSQDQYQIAHSLFDKIRADLTQAQAGISSGDLGDGPRFDIARSQLTQLEKQWDQARFATGTFDKTYAAIQMVLNDNRLTGYDRNALSADQSRLLEFRGNYY
jgi:hypothetical protein